MIATHASLFAQALSSSQQAARSGSVQLAGEGAIPPQVGTLTPHASLQFASRQIFAPDFVQDPGRSAAALAVSQQFAS